MRPIEPPVAQVSTLTPSSMHSQVRLLTWKDCGVGRGHTYAPVAMFWFPRLYGNRTFEEE